MDHEALSPAWRKLRVHLKLAPLSPPRIIPWTPPLLAVATSGFLAYDQYMTDTECRCLLQTCRGFRLMEGRGVPTVGNRPAASSDPPEHEAEHNPCNVPAATSDPPNHEGEHESQPLQPPPLSELQQDPVPPSPSSPVCPPSPASTARLDLEARPRPLFFSFASRSHFGDVRVALGGSWSAVSVQALLCTARRSPRLASCRAPVPNPDWDDGDVWDTDSGAASPLQPGETGLGEPAGDLVIVVDSDVDEGEEPAQDTGEARHHQDQQGETEPAGDFVVDGDEEDDSRAYQDMDAILPGISWNRSKKAWVLQAAVTEWGASDSASGGKQWKPGDRLNMQFKAASYEHFHDPQDPVRALRSKQTALAIAESVLSCLMEAGKVQKVQEREKPKTRGVYCVRKRQEKGQACWTFRFGGRENRHSGAYYRTESEAARACETARQQAVRDS